MTHVTITKVTPAIWSVYRDGKYVGQVERVGRRYRKWEAMYRVGRTHLRDAVADLIAEHDLRELPLFEGRRW